MKRQRADGPAHEPLIAALAGIIFLIVGGRHGGTLGLSFTVLGFAVIALGAITFLGQLFLWWRGGKR